MPYEISTEVTFSSAHFIEGYPGDCANMHGHNWTVRAALRSAARGEGGLTYDFRRIKSLLEEVIEPLDHAVLNDIPHFKQNNPTAEVIAEWIYRKLAARVNGDGVSLSRVEVWENPLNCAVFSEE
ncbi:MAG: 6-carboxytetrahydropterin synthase QueD [bacterium]|jgi:6-pyruvoyltetrahydropterin/6-carboxytetrahydropterin synthase